MKNPDISYKDLPPMVKYLVDIHLKEMGKLPEDQDSEESDVSKDDLEQAVRNLSDVVRDR